MKVFEIEILFIYQAVSCLNTSPVIKKALHIASSTYAPNHASTVVWQTDELGEVASFLRYYPGTVVISPNNPRAILHFNKMVGYQQTVFFASAVEEFTAFISVLKLDLIVPLHLILVLTSQVTDAEVSLVTKSAFENDLANIIVVSAKGNESVDLTTYFPYSRGVCGNHAPVKIHPENKKWFPKKFLNFQGCPIKVTLLQMPPYAKLAIENDTVKSISGLDGTVFMILIKELNASMDIVSWRHHGDIGTFVNSTVTGSFGDLVNRHAEVLVPAAIINYFRYPVAQISPVYETIDVFWFGPPRQEVEESLRVLQPLMSDITPACIVTFIIFIFATKIVIRFGLHRVNFTYGVTFQSLIVFLGQEIKFESKYQLVNCLFVMWIWFCLIVRTVYQGELFDGLEKNKLEKPLMNLREAVMAVDGYGGSEAIREIYRGTSYFQNYKVLTLQDAASYVTEISAGRRFLLAADRLLVYDLSYGVQMVNEPILNAPACFFMRPGWPASEEISHAIQQLVESGFAYKVFKDHVNEWMKKEVHHARHEIHPLDMDTLIVYFYVLVLSYFVCILVFVVELVHSKLTSKYKIQNLSRGVPT